MKKTDKRMENAIRAALTEVCELALHEVGGFKWITHFANYRSFPSSLSVVCVFDTNADLSDALIAQKDDYLCHLIKEKLSAVGIYIKDMGQHVNFDSEEACKNDHGGKWHERFK